MAKKVEMWKKMWKCGKKCENVAKEVEKWEKIEKGERKNVEKCKAN